MDCPLKPEGLELFEHPGCGRGLRSLRPYSKYDVVVLAEPVLLTVRHDVSPWYCQSCFVCTREGLGCDKCKHAVYCSAKCQEDHRKAHEHECKLWSEEPEYPHFSLIQLSRALLMLKGGDCSFKKITESLVSYEDALGTSWNQESEAGLVHWITSMRAYAPNMIPTNWTDAQIRRVYFAIKLNAFNVKPGAGEAARAHASGLFPHLALFNHGCEPNCGIQYFGNHQIRLVALRDIEIGEELTIAYTNPYSSDRRKLLKENFFFECACPKCLRNEDIINLRNDVSLIQQLDELQKCSTGDMAEAANSILDEAMKLRAQNALDSPTAEALLSSFVDAESGELCLVRTVSPDSYWNWIVFMVDCAIRAQNLPLRQRLAARGLEVLVRLYVGAEEPPNSVVPYLNYFNTNL